MDERVIVHLEATANRQGADALLHSPPLRQKDEAFCKFRAFHDLNDTIRPRLNRLDEAIFVTAGVYLSDLQQRKLKLIADIKEVSASHWLGSRVDSAWREVYGTAHPAALEVARADTRGVQRADGKRCKVGG